MDRGHVIWIVLLSVIPAGRPAAWPAGDICASCHAHATCSILPDGSGHACICMYGFIGNGRSLCQDKDECQIGARKICGPHAACHNTVGSYTCTCMGGFRPSNHRTTFTPNDGTYCQDIDECGRHPAVCGEGARCVNLEGDFECRCLLGYRAHNASDPFQPLRDKGSCKVVDCGPPPAGEAVRVLSTNGTAYGSVVLMGCKDGFLWRRGDNSSTCGPDGTWSRPAPLCQARCRLTPSLAHAEVASYNSSMTVHRCVDGYRSSRGSSVSVCGNAGQWQKATLKCIEIQCGEPLSKPHARMLWDNGTRVGSVLHYQCEEGYRPSTNRHSPSTNRSVCGVDGQWEESDLRCEEVSCGIPLIVPGTKRMWDGRSSAGSKVLYMCSASYYPESGQGSFNSTCSETGEWGHVPLNCRARCRLTPSLAHAEVAWYNSSVTVHRCVDGYRSSRGSSISVCGNAGQWQKATLKCIEIQCGEPLSKPHARMLWDNGTRVGSVLHYQCEEGYRPSTNRHSPSTNRSVCGVDGQWEESDLRCEELSCGTPLIVPGTKRMWDGRSSAGNKVLYMCSASYYPESGQGSVNSTCSETGEWGHVPLNCRVKPNHPKEGRVESNHPEQ